MYAVILSGDRKMIWRYISVWRDMLSDIELLVISQLKETHKIEVARLKGEIERQHIHLDKLQQLEEIVADDVDVCGKCYYFDYKENMGRCDVCNQDFCGECVDALTVCNGCYEIYCEICGPCLVEPP
jgi:hypothetical protein